MCGAPSCQLFTPMVCMTEGNAFGHVHIGPWYGWMCGATSAVDVDGASG